MRKIEVLPRHHRHQSTTCQLFKWTMIQGLKYVVLYLRIWLQDASYYLDNK